MRFGIVAVLCMGCAHPVAVPTTLSGDGAHLWMGVDGAPPEDMAALHFTSEGRNTTAARCQAPQRGRPLWQQLDIGSVRVVCTANPNHLRRSERLEQRYQAPVALAPSAVDHVIIAVPEHTKHGARLHADLLTVADPLALRLDVRRGDSTRWALPDGAWGVMHLTLGQDQTVVLSQDETGLTLRQSDGATAAWTPMSGWSL